MAEETVDRGKHYYCDEGTDEDPTPVHRCNQNEPELGPVLGAEFCPHPGQPCIDGCYYCGRPVGSLDGNHHHTEYGKGKYSCVCESC